LTKKNSSTVLQYYTEKNSSTVYIIT